MRAAVTGGAGFLGSHLVDRLAEEEWETLVVDNLATGRVSNLAAARRRGAVGVHQLDITSDGLFGALERFAPEVVFHLAAQTSVSASVADAKHDAMVNIVGSLNVLQAASAAGARRVVFVSTGGAIYGRTSWLPTPETENRNPESPYGVSKLAVEGYLRLWRAAHGLEYVILGPSNIYGPRQDPHGEAGVVAIFSRACLDRTPPVIFGDGEDTRDYVYVDDVVDALVRAAERGEGCFYNIGTGVETSVNRLYALVAGEARFGGGAEYAPPRPGDIPRSCLDYSLARRELGWEPYTPLAEGVAATVEWFADPD